MARLCLRDRRGRAPAAPAGLRARGADHDRRVPHAGAAPGVFGARYHADPPARDRDGAVADRPGARDRGADAVTRQRVIVTGGAGFIGAHFVRDLLASEPATEVIVLDKMTYAGNAQAIEALSGNPRFSFVRGCICDRELVRGVLAAHQPDAIVHLAAETHVDRSIDGPADFIATNVLGTFGLLEESRRYLAQRARPFRFVHVSTDEVFGAL